MLVAPPGLLRIVGDQMRQRPEGPLLSEVSLLKPTVPMGLSVTMSSVEPVPVIVMERLMNTSPDERSTAVLPPVLSMMENGAKTPVVALKPCDATESMVRLVPLNRLSVAGGSKAT